MSPMNYPTGEELCEMAIVKADAQSADWVNTVVGIYYCAKNSIDRYNCGRGESVIPWYEGVAITERLLADFINSGVMPATDIDLRIGFTREARRKSQEQADQFFKEVDTP